MDVEKTIQFLIERSAEHDARIATIEQILARTAEKQERFADELAETNRRLAEMDKKRISMGEELDQRIAALVSAIVKLSETRSRN